MATNITINTLVNARIDKVWVAWTEPQHITRWNYASEDWHCPAAENDVRPGGKLKWTMAAKDNSITFDFEGTYTHIEPNHTIEYVVADGRHVKITFRQEEDGIRVTETFEAESLHPVEMQKAGWQAILENFRKHTEGL
jgi:uncharacterized protein YndB with AHSA1/START domain